MRFVKNLTGLLYILTLLVTLGGLLAFYANREFLGGWPANQLPNRVLWLAAAGWFAGLLLARLLPPHDASLRRVNRDESAPRAEERPPVMAPAVETGGPTRERQVERLRLEALMRGARPEPAVFVQQAVATAMAVGASDLHFQPAGQECRVTLRVRGELRDLASYPLARHGDVVRRLKVLAELPPYVDDSPQDGRLSIDTPHGTAQIRLSTVPARDGERVALRLAGEATMLSLDELGLFEDDRQRLEKLLDEPQGMIVLTGPTGSGKTTTLYSAMQHIHRTRGATVALASIEDPIEVDVPFAHQVPVDRGRGMAFATALRSVLRQDPNVLMIGEIRDSETARTAVQAGLSGHLILTTLHSDSAVGVFPRLIDLGTEPFLAASATLASVAQRLARRLCPDCRHPRSLTSEHRRLLADRLTDPEQALAEATFYTAEGCSACERSGLRGRAAIFEILALSPDLRRLVTQREPIDRLVKASREAGNSTLMDSALRLAKAGEISLDELARVVR